MADIINDYTQGRPPIRVGIVGLGRAAQLHTIPQLEAMPAFFKLTAICDLLKDRRDMVEQKFPGLRTYRRVEDMVEDPEIDLFYIALPSLGHESVVMTCLQHDKWTLVETPLALSHDKAMMIRAQAVKSHNRLIVAHRGLFDPDYRLALMALEDPRLGDLYEVRVRRQTYLRRDDWQACKRCGGGVSHFVGPDCVLQAIQLCRTQPIQLWSELKRVAALGDSEDFAHIVLKTRTDVTADIEINGGKLPPYDPSFTIRGSRGEFTVMPGAREGNLHVIDPAFTLPRRRASVRTPDVAELNETIPIVDIPFALPADAQVGAEAFWRAVWSTMRRALPFAVTLEESVEAVRYLQFVKQASSFAK